MAELDTNFVDAVLSANMNGKKRVRLTQIAENEYIVEDITEYEKVGSEYGQKEINTLNETVNGKVDKVEVIDDLDTVKAVTEDNVPVGCKAVTKFANDVNQSLTWKQVKTEGKYFDFSNINYKEIHIIAYYNNYRVSCSFTQDDNGNYYFGSNEPGWVGAVIIKDNTNKDISLQNFLLSGSDVTIDANIAVYYR